MKIAIVCAFLVIAMPSLAFGQSTCSPQSMGGSIGLYSDYPEMCSCFLMETLYVNNYIYVVHEGVPEARTVQFMIEHNWGAIPGATEYGANLNLGDPYTGVTITYVGCKPLPHLLCTLPFIPVATTPTCGAEFQVVPDPVLSSGSIEVVDCDGNVLFGSASNSLFVNGNVPDCLCAWCGPLCPPITTEETTWGKVKSLYQ